VIEGHRQERAGEPGYTGTGMGIRQHRAQVGARGGAAGGAGARGHRGEHGRGGGRRDPGREFHVTEHTPAPYPVVIRPVSGRLADGWLDTRCFEEHARQAHDALATGDREEAARLLRAGLALWRGPALSGIDRPFAEIEAARLEERRLLVTEEHIGLELDLGRHEELVGDLLALVRAHPLRERLRSLLMLALQQAGRRAEALAAYQDGRQLLIE